MVRAFRFARVDHMVTPWPWPIGRKINLDSSWYYTWNGRRWWTKYTISPCDLTAHIFIMIWQGFTAALTKKMALRSKFVFTVNLSGDFMLRYHAGMMKTLRNLVIFNLPFGQRGKRCFFFTMWCCPLQKALWGCLLRSCFDMLWFGGFWFRQHLPGVALVNSAII